MKCETEARDGRDGTKEKRPCERVVLRAAGLKFFALFVCVGVVLP